MTWPSVMIAIAVISLIAAAFGLGCLIVGLYEEYAGSKSMSEQLDVAVLDRQEPPDVERLSLLFQELTGRMPSELELKDAHQRLWNRSRRTTNARPE